MDNPNQQPIYTLKFCAQIGVLVRKEFRNSITRYCFTNNLELHIVESKGWLSSDYYISVKGTFTQIENFKDFLGRLDYEWNDDTLARH